MAMWLMVTSANAQNPQNTKACAKPGDHKGLCQTLRSAHISEAFRHDVEHHAEQDADQRFAREDGVDVEMDGRDHSAAFVVFLFKTRDAGFWLVP